jgi:hypothetical protein
MEALNNVYYNEENHVKKATRSRNIAKSTAVVAGGILTVPFQFG